MRDIRDTATAAAAGALALALTVTAAVLIDERIDPHSGLVQIAPAAAAPTASPSVTQLTESPVAPAPHADPAPIDLNASICGTLDNGAPIADLYLLDLPVDTPEQAAALIDEVIAAECPHHITQE